MAPRKFIKQRQQKVVKYDNSLRKQKFDFSIRQKRNMNTDDSISPDFIRQLSDEIVATACKSANQEKFKELLGSLVKEKEYVFEKIVLDPRISLLLEKALVSFEVQHISIYIWNLATGSRDVVEKICREQPTIIRWLIKDILENNNELSVANEIGILNNICVCGEKYIKYIYMNGILANILACLEKWSQRDRFDKNVIVHGLGLLSFVFNLNFDAITLFPQLNTLFNNVNSFFTLQGNNIDHLRISYLMMKISNILTRKNNHDSWDIAKLIEENWFEKFMKLAKTIESVKSVEVDGKEYSFDDIIQSLVIFILNKSSDVDNDSVSKFVQKFNVKDFLMNCLNHTNPNIRADACSCFGNLCLTSPEMSQDLYDCGLIFKCLDLLNDVNSVSAQVIWVMSCFSAFCSPELVEGLFGHQPNFINFIAEKLNPRSSPELICYCLDTLENLYETRHEMKNIDIMQKYLETDIEKKLDELVFDEHIEESLSQTAEEIRDLIFQEKDEEMSEYLQSINFEKLINDGNKFKFTF